MVPTKTATLKKTNTPVLKTVVPTKRNTMVPTKTTTLKKTNTPVKKTVVPTKRNTMIPTKTTTLKKTNTPVKITISVVRFYTSTLTPIKSPTMYRPVTMTKVRPAVNP
jgi:hypothetical protein